MPNGTSPSLRSGEGAGGRGFIHPTFLSFIFALSTSHTIFADHLLHPTHCLSDEIGGLQNADA